MLYCSVEGQTTVVVQSAGNVAFELLMRKGENELAGIQGSQITLGYRDVTSDALDFKTVMRDDSMVR